MRPLAVQFGAGAIGRGFMAQLFHESGFDIIFVELPGPVLTAINERKAYPIYIVGPGEQTVIIDSILAVGSQERAAIVEAIRRAAILCTAVGAGALPKIAPVLAEGLLARRRDGAGPINIILCENLHGAANFLREEVQACLDPDDRVSAIAGVGFVQAVVSRMAPVQTESDRAADSLAVRVEAYKRLPIDGRAIVGVLPETVGIEPVGNFEALVERKLYTHNCAHAVLGYLGYAAGQTYGYEALVEPRIASLLRAVLAETGEALVRRHGFSPEEQAAHEADLMARFANRALGDTCLRLARDPIRKLAPDDRLVGAARLCESVGILPRALTWAIAAALRFDAPDDPSAQKLQRMLSETGREVTLEKLCGIDPAEPLAAMIDEALVSANAEDSI